MCPTNSYRPVFTYNAATMSSTRTSMCWLVLSATESTMCTSSTLRVHYHHTDDQPQSDSWTSESEEEDIPNAPPGNWLSPGGHGTRGINLRVAMAQAKLPPIADKRINQAESHPITEPRPPMGVVNSPPVSVVNSSQVGVASSPPVGVVNIQGNDITMSDWDDDEEEDSVRPHPFPLDSTHIPAVIGASKEPSAVQSERMGVSERVMRGGSEHHEQRSEVISRMGMELGHESESESDLPMFDGFIPTTILQSPHRNIPPISQGPPPVQSKASPSPTPTSPIVVTPLSATTAGTCTFSVQHVVLTHVLQSSRVMYTPVIILCMYICRWTVSRKWWTRRR